MTATAGPAALLPMSPTGVVARRGSDGITISWVRRARLDADSWESVDIPLDESSEAYRISVMKGTAVIRQCDVGNPNYLYAAADELTDFGTRQTTLGLMVQQLSTSVGAGQALVLSVSIV